jgi:Na+/proline symporter
MASGHQFEIDSMRDKQKPLHPIWRGIGCILLVGLMSLGYLFAGWFLETNKSTGWIRIPAEFSFPPAEPYLFIKLILAFIFLLLSTAAITLIYALVHPPKPGKFDVIDPSIFPPPPKRRKR